MATTTERDMEPDRSAIARGAVVARSALSRFGGMAVAAILPAQCLSCRARIADHPGLCAQCWRGIDFIEPPCCPRTGLPFAYDPGPGTVSAVALARPPVWNRARAAAAFGPVSRQLVHALKYRDRLEVAGLLGRLMVRTGGDLLGNAELIAPVPLYRGRLWTRRYNQSALLAGAIAAHAGVPANMDALRRTRPTRAQVGLNMAERRRNVRGAFAPGDVRTMAVAGRRVLLVDDVITTGATAGACVAALLGAGARQVDVLA
ncbi:MAG: ComF family protein, partial [Hyphomicrobiales bacterium]